MTTPHIIIALGNPTETYATTRHNVGFLFADFYVTQKALAPFTHKKKLHASCSINICTCTKCIIAKPTTYMNHSGTAARALVSYYDSAPTDLIVIHDDLDIAFGAYKISRNKNAAGHGGVQDIITHLGTKDFTRVRIGIDARNHQQRQNQPGRDYVLGQFSAKEKALLPDIFHAILKEKIFSR